MEPHLCGKTTERRGDRTGAHFPASLITRLDCRVPTTRFLVTADLQIAPLVGGWMAYVVLPLILLGREPHQQGTEHPSLLLWLLVRREESAFHRQDKLIYTGEPPLSRSFPHHRAFGA